MGLSETEFAARLLEQRDWLADLARHLGGDTEAEDLAQETWLAVLRQPAGRGDPRAWLSSVARNLARGLRRARRHRFERERRSARPEALPSTVELVERLDTEQRLARELVALREPYRTTLLLRFHEGRSAEEIAVSQGIPAGTVRWRTKQGLDELRAKLERVFGGRAELGLVLLPIARPVHSGSAMSAGGALGAGGIFMGLAGTWGAGGVLALVLAGFGWVRWMTDGAEKQDRATEERMAEERLDSQAEADVPRGAPPLSSDPGQRQAPRSVALRSRLRLRESDGSVHAQRRVEVRAAEQTGIEAVRTDSDGCIEFAADGATCELAIEREQAFPFRATFRCAPGDHELRLPRGEVISGRITVLGGAQAEILELALYPAWSFGSEAHADKGLFECTHARLQTAADGSFEVFGLDAQAYDLVLPLGYALPDTLPFSDPDARLVLRDLRAGRGQVFEVERFPSVRGRLVGRDGLPTAGAVDARLTWQDGTNHDSGAVADDSGRFELFLQHPWRAVRLSYHGRPGLRGDAVFESTFDEHSDGNLGDLELAPGRDLELVVLSLDGLPIQGARTEVGDAPTDERGRTFLREVSFPEINIVARGHRASSVRLPPEPEAVLTVQLEPAPELLLEIRDARGEPVPEINVRMLGPRPFFAGCEGNWPNMSQRTLCERAIVTAGRRPGSAGFGASFRSDPCGRLRVGDLAAGIELTVLVLSPGAGVVHEERLAPLEETEQRSLSIQLTRPLVRLHGRVLDSQGKPVPAAGIALSPVVFEGSSSFSPLRTGIDGRFEHLILDCSGLELSVSKTGYTSDAVELAGIPEQELVLVLERGLDVHVRVEDEAGVLQPGGMVSYRKEGRSRNIRIGARPVALGRYELLGLEPGRYELELSFGGRTFSLLHVADRPEAVFRVPCAGAVEVSWEIASVEPWLRWLSLELRPLDPALAVLPCVRTDAPRGSRRFVPVLPGEYEIRLLYDDGETPVHELARRALVVAAGETTTIDLRASWP